MLPLLSFYHFAHHTPNGFKRFEGGIDHQFPSSSYYTMYHISKTHQVRRTRRGTGEEETICSGLLVGSTPSVTLFWSILFIIVFFISGSVSKWRLCVVLLRQWSDIMFSPFRKGVITLQLLFFQFLFSFSFVVNHHLRIFFHWFTERVEGEGKTEKH